MYLPRFVWNVTQFFVVECHQPKKRLWVLLLKALLINHMFSNKVHLMKRSSSWLKTARIGPKHVRSAMELTMFQWFRKLMWDWAYLARRAETRPDPLTLRLPNSSSSRGPCSYTATCTTHDSRHWFIISFIKWIFHIKNALKTNIFICFQNRLWKNVALVSCQLYYAGSNAFSVQSAFHSLFTIFYNIFFTALPIVAYGKSIRNTFKLF